MEFTLDYIYDALGNILSITGLYAGTLGAVNPIRYRGYYYDTETGFYYLQSRYYDPSIGRFINADSFASTGQGFLGYNSFAYCLNNPVNRIDSLGNVSLWYYLIVDHDMGYIHRAVVGHIKDNYHVSTEVPLTTFGRADILQNRAIWEVKHSGKNPLARTSEALAQSFTYILLNEEVGSLGQADAFSGEFYIGCEGYSYQVKYYTPLPGVVLYSVSEVSNYTGAYYRVYVPESLSEKEKQTNSALGIGAAGAGVGFAMSYGCPSSCFSGGGMTSVFPNRANCFN